MAEKENISHIGTSSHGMNVSFAVVLIIGVRADMILNLRITKIELNILNMLAGVTSYEK